MTSRTATRGRPAAKLPKQADPGDPARSVPFAADYAGVHRSTIYKAMDAGQLSYFEFTTPGGKKIRRIRQSELDRYVAAP